MRTQAATRVYASRVPMDIIETSSPRSKNIDMIPERREQQLHYWVTTIRSIKSEQYSLKIKLNTHLCINLNNLFHKIHELTSQNSGYNGCINWSLESTVDVGQEFEQQAISTHSKYDSRHRKHCCQKAEE